MMVAARPRVTERFTSATAASIDGTNPSTARRMSQGSLTPHDSSTVRGTRMTMTAIMRMAPM